MAEMDEDIEPLELYPCGICGRTFLPAPLRKHEKICEKTSKKRKPFNSLAQRVSGTDLAVFHMKSYLKPNGKQQQSPYTCAGSRTGLSPGGAIERTSREKSPVKARHHREVEHSSSVTHNEEVKASPSTTHLEPVVQKRSTSSIRTPATPVGERCPHCDRTFGHRAFERHVEWCKEHQSRVQTSPASVKMAKERLEARTKYRAPAIKSQRSIVREKYSSHKFEQSRRSPSQNRRDSSADEEEAALMSVGRGLSRTGSLRQNSIRRDDEKTVPIRRSASMRRETRKVSEVLKTGEGDNIRQSPNVKRTPSVRRTSKPTGYLSRQSSQDEGISRRVSRKEESAESSLTPMKTTHIESVCPNMSSPVISDQTYDPFVLAERQLQELLSDNQIPFVVTKTPLQYTPRPSTAPCQPSIHESSISKRTSGSNLTLPNIYEPKSAFVPIIKQNSPNEQKPDKTNNKIRKESTERNVKKNISSNSINKREQNNKRDNQNTELQIGTSKAGKSQYNNDTNKNIEFNKDSLSSFDSFKGSLDNKNIESDENTTNSEKNSKLESQNNNNDKKVSRGSIIDPPNDFQDEMKMFQDNFEFIENLVNENYNAELSESGTDSNLDIFNTDNRKFSNNVEKEEIMDNSKSNLDSFEKENTEKEDIFVEKKTERKSSNKAKYNLDSKSMLSLNSILNDNHRHNDMYNSQIDPCLINSVDNLSIPDHLRSEDADHYSVQYDKQIATLEPLVLTKTEMNTKRLQYDSDSINDDFDIDGFIAVLDDDDTFPTVKSFLKNQSHPSIISDHNSLRQSSISLNSSIIARQKSPESLKGSSSMTYLKKSVSSLLDPVSKPRSLRNKGDVEKYFGDKVDKKKPEEKKTMPEELFSVDDEMYEEYKKYEQMYLQEKMLAEANKKSSRDSIKAKRNAVVYGDESSPEDLSSPERQHNESRMDSFGKPSGDSAYSSLNRSSPKPYSRTHHQHRVRNDRLHAERDRCPSSSGSDISLPPVSSAFHKSNAIHKSMINSITPRHFDFEPVAHDDGGMDKFRSIESSETLHEDEKSAVGGSRKSSLDSNASGRLSKFCYECGSAFPVSTAKFCVNCGVARLVL